jgi:transposase
MVLAGKALDETRRELQRQGVDLKGAMWSLRGNCWNLGQERQEQRKSQCRKYTKLGRAMSLRETLQAIYTNSDRQSAEAETCLVAQLGNAQPAQCLPRLSQDRP